MVLFVTDEVDVADASLFSTCDNKGMALSGDVPEMLSSVPSPA